MRIVALTLCSAACAAVAAMTAAAPALAEQRHSATTTIRISPRALAPGTEVEVWAFGCPDRVATASSPVFVDDAELTPEGDALFSEATIRSTAAKGAHRVTLDCAAGGLVRADGTSADGTSADGAGADGAGGEGVDGEGADGQGGAGRVALAVERPPSPVAPVRAGGGGAAPDEARPRDDIGAAEAYGLVLSGGTAVAVGGLAVHRRRHPSRAAS
ncbi:hypothetical protein JK364_42040 [Streptomyces sp. 110]|uniref:Uncharacterized protein n=1 Tax=Streptomyces endocoffeicus TaxID=2898945 RepID=A0ABS1Q3R8_9ACTN|nr:hypothetical protein [Streptomyces endocoffeicus]MBL1118900.1 hypothetical protein [Streptomyces endocoffeicus]